MTTKRTSGTLAKSFILLIGFLVSGILGADKGFELFFKSNPDEVVNAPIQFDRPLPKWLSGTLVRNGLGLFQNGDRSFLHAFDGFSKLTSWRFHSNGSAFFSTRFLASEFYKESKSMNSIAPFLLFDTVSPRFSLFERMNALMKGLDNMNVNVYSLLRPDGGHGYVALSDYWKMYEISPLDLSTKASSSPWLYNGPGDVASEYGFMKLLSSAHPLPEPSSDFHLNFLSRVSLLPWNPNQIQLVRLLSTKQYEVVASWEVAQMPYMHSFTVTRNYALILSHPFYVNMLCMMSKVTPFDCLEWHADRQSTLYVVHLKSGNLTRLTMDNVFTMHHVNGYEVDEGLIAMDISTYPNPGFVSNLRLDVLLDPVRRNSFPAHALLQRYEVDLCTMRVQRIELTPPTPAFISFLDMPTINENHRSRHYCFVYGLVVRADNVSLDSVAIVKRDLCGMGRDKYWLVPEHYPVEPVFVPNPQGTREDDGLVLVPMIDGAAGRSYMAVLDAQNMTIISSAVLPTLVPYSLHGHFFQEVV